MKWRNIAGASKYQVSDMGTVRSLHKWRSYNDEPRLLKSVLRKKAGYTQVTIRYDDGKARTPEIHRLVLEAFVGPCPPGKVCRHRNGNGSDNRLSNLRWGTPKQNCLDRDRHGTTSRGERHPCTTLTDKKVIEIRRRYETEEVSQADLGREYGQSKGIINTIVNNKTWRHLPHCIRKTEL